MNHQHSITRDNIDHGHQKRHDGAGHHRGAHCGRGRNHRDQDRGDLRESGEGGGEPGRRHGEDGGGGAGRAGGVRQQLV